MGELIEETHALTESTEPSILFYLVEHDAWVNVLSNLTIKEIAFTRRVCRQWYIQGKQRMTLYRIGLGANGWSRWETDKEKTYGWGMCISVDCQGNVRGANKNDHQHAGTAKEKVYNGSLVNGNFKIHTFFPSTKQENEYTGRFVEENGKTFFSGAFRLLQSTGHRAVGSGGLLHGLVCEA